MRSAPSLELPAGTLVQGTPYVAVYNSSDGAFYLQNFFANPYSVPIGGMIDYTGSTAPNSSFVLAYGQAVSRSTYATYFSLVSTTFGSGDGSTTFNVPDLRGRVVAGLDNMGGSAASRLTSTYFGTGATTLGGVGSSGESTTLVTGNLPPYTPAGSVSLSMNPLTNALDNLSSSTTGGGAFGFNYPASQSSPTPTGTATFTGTSQGGTSTPLRVVQPTMVLSKILRII